MGVVRLIKLVFGALRVCYGCLAASQGQIPGFGCPLPNHRFLIAILIEFDDFLPLSVQGQIPGFDSPLANQRFPIAIPIEFDDFLPLSLRG